MSIHLHFPRRSQILGLPFFNGTSEEAVQAALHGACVVAPSGPNLAAEFLRVPAYRAALQQADVILTDSAVMLGVYRRITGHRVHRISGLRFLNDLLKKTELRAPQAVLWVMPSASEGKKIGAWLTSQHFADPAASTYIAPYYQPGAIEDPVLLQQIRAQKPKLVVLNIAGGKQEVLAAWLKAQGIAAGIVCTGAAIAFLAGTQASIPGWADRAGLGWLCRCISQPGKFIPRYVQALPLVPLVLRYRENLPPQRA